MAQIPTRQRILASQNLWKHEGQVTTQKRIASTANVNVPGQAHMERMHDAHRAAHRHLSMTNVLRCTF